MFGLTARILKRFSSLIPARKELPEEKEVTVKFPDCGVTVDRYDPSKIRATITFDGSEYDVGSFQDGTLRIIERHGFLLLPQGYYARKKKQGKRYKYRGVKRS